MNAETCKRTTRSFYLRFICAICGHLRSPFTYREAGTEILRCAQDEKSVPTRAEHLERLLDCAVPTGLEIAGRKDGDLDRRRNARAVVTLSVRHESLVR